MSVLFEICLYSSYGMIVWWLSCYFRFCPVPIMRVWFTLIFALTLISLWTSTLFVHVVLRGSGILSATTSGKLNSLITAICFKTCLLMCPHIRLIPINKNVDKVFASALNEKNILCGFNHTSFFDGFAGLSIAPLWLTWKVRSIYKSSLSNIPLWGATYKRREDFAVYFTSNDKFTTDREKQDRETERMKQWVTQEGGTIALFPEGQLNKDPFKIQPIRHGMLKFAVEHKLPFYIVVQDGSYRTWPLDAPGGIGGFPADIFYDVRRFEFELKDEKSGKVTEETIEQVALRVQASMQEMVDNIQEFRKKRYLDKKNQ